MVTLGDQFVAVRDQVAQLLSQDGLVIERVYPFGVIKGTADNQAISKLRGHREVQEVKEEKTVHLAPPGSNIQ